MHTMDGMADHFIKDVTAAVAELMKNPEKPVEGKVLNFEKISFLLYFISSNGNDKFDKFFH